MFMIAYHGLPLSGLYSGAGEEEGEAKVSYDRRKQLAKLRVKAEKAATKLEILASTCHQFCRTLSYLLRLEYLVLNDATCN